MKLLYQEGLKLISQLTKQPILNLFPNDNSENIIDTFEPLADYKKQPVI